MKEQPDLNYRNPKVVEEMKNVLRFWLERGVGGFRIDAINYLFEVEDFRDEPLSGHTSDPNSHAYTHHYYTQDLNETYDMVYQWREVADQWRKEHGGDVRVLMTEAYTNSTEYPRYFVSRDNPKRLGSQIPFNFVPLLNLRKYSTANDFAKYINEVIESVPHGTRLNWVMGNHDSPRYGSTFGEQKIDAIMTLLMTLPGVAITYNVSVWCPVAAHLINRT